MNDYAERLAELRLRLDEAGEPEIAAELLTAERTGSTSGEILAQTAVILRRLLKSGEAKRLNLAKEVKRLDRLASSLFKTRHRP